VSAKTRTYVVEDNAGNIRLIEAGTPAQARGHATRTDFKVRVPSQAELIKILTGASPPEIEVATAESKDEE